ncbi:beta-ureidopropionase [Burkholderiales bacterium]|nr:beta-ureidopropionase [Burkholderiales bacterium]
MPRTLTVAAAQTGPVLSEDMHSMVPTAIRMIDEAAERGVDILAFCELFLSPFFPNRLREDVDHFFVAPDCDVIRTIVDAARRRHVALVLPFGERAAAGRFNAALVVDADGRTVGTYRKVHIPAYFPNERPGGTGSYERMYFTPGDDLPVFDVAGSRIGVQICYDRQFPEGSRALVLKGAEILFMPICYSVYGDPEHRAEAWEIPLRARAFENGVFVVAANKVGSEGVRRHLGKSMIVSPEGRILASAGTTGEELVVQAIDLDEASIPRKRMPWWRDRRPDLYRSLA